MAEGINVTGNMPAQQSGTQQAQLESREPRRVDGSNQQVEKGDAVKAAKDTAEKTEISAEELQTAIDQLNDFMNQGQRSLSFSVDKEAGEVVVAVVDKETDELIRQIPSPEALELKKHLDGVIGLLFNDKA